ncbi:hypothetical protein [Comamonas terrigena]|uniref:hypothetical protein n=1 Tax=Comamonas terrigena TaxID=32013 RepID=UPI000B1AAC74|nr:hypothetical protein [Comamonas terrigena]BBL25479.1 hypothetical protein CT3_29340 [Comamonas terrigena NBRC 13299]SUY70949.1 Uncharacterised protein [Comamonas terrigena]
MFSLRLSPALEEQLENLALMQETTKTALTIKAIEVLVAQMQPSQDALQQETGEKKDINSLRNQEFQKRLNYEKEITNPQINKIFSWMSRGNIWTKKRGIFESDGCPHGDNFVKGYTILNEGDADQQVAVIAQHRDSYRAIESRYHYVIPFDTWKEKMVEIAATN